MTERIFQDLDTLSRIRALEDNALDIAEDYSYHRPLSDDEVADLRNEFAEKHMEIENLQKKKAALMAEINGELKAKKITASAALSMIRTGKEEVSGTVYFIQDFDAGKIKVYDAEGILISERPMKQADRQARIFQSKTGTE
jgi:hypothetical protein